ncbi:hypothetical protein CHARACLAT_024910 [Characodon lateralis]|uniref:Uncharacterized protein n=1 Tax=Characodon lateralis TaxID=208331 RepID=A0ABU7EX29_9TELE|nr:hypothetical protein [Characodon lateralis]
MHPSLSPPTDRGGRSQSAHIPLGQHPSDFTDTVLIEQAERGAHSQSASFSGAPLDEEKLRTGGFLPLSREGVHSAGGFKVMTELS